MAKVCSAGFDGKEFYYEGRNGERRVLLNVAEATMREGIQSMGEIRSRGQFMQQGGALLSLLLKSLQRMGQGYGALAASMMFLLSVEAMSWKRGPYRFLRIGGSGEDVLSVELGNVLGKLHGGSRFYVLTAGSTLPEGEFDGVILDRLGGCPDRMAVEARRRLKQDGLLLCVDRQKSRQKFLQLPDDACEEFAVSREIRLLVWQRMGKTHGKGFHRKEVVAFFPYRASMWDSLESIWRAADADKEHCVAYVIPAPYADLDENGQAEQWHHEMDLFPEEVPVVDFRQIELSHLRPDIAYIHYPYEDDNGLALVDERFRASALRQFVGQLVYVPYFTTGRCWPEIQLHAACYPYVDKIVVQRSHMEVSHNEYLQSSKLKAGTTYFLEDFLPQEKLMPLGSPKIDRLFWCERHRKMPEGWAERIGNRKVVLYNTSTSGLGSYGKIFLRKMEYVFQSFANRKDVVLLWRPHPLIEKVAERCGREVHEGYLELRQRFLDENLGILDETPDVDMSIAIADAYMGEGSSSLVSMFGFVGKPIFLATAMMLQKCPSEEEKTNIWFQVYFFEGKNCYFRPNGYDALCRMDMESRQVMTVMNFGDAPEGEAYGAPWRDAAHGNLLYFAPRQAKDILVFDTALESAQRIPVKDALPKANFCGMFPCKEYLFFLPDRYPFLVRLHRETHAITYFPLKNPLAMNNMSGAISYKEALYLLPNQYPAIVRVDVQTGEMVYHEECMEGIRKTRTARHSNVLAGHCVRNGRYLLLAFRFTNQVMEFDMETGDWRYIAAGPEDVDSDVMLKESEDVYWIFPWQTRKIRRWNCSTGECEVLEEYPAGYECAVDWVSWQDTYLFSHVKRIGDEVWLYPCYGNMMLKLDMKQKRLLKWEMELPPQGEREGSSFVQQSMFLGLFDYDGKLWAQRSYDRKFLVIDKKTQEISVEPAVHMSVDMACSLMAPIADSFGQVNEEVPYAVKENLLGHSVEAFLDYVAGGGHDRELQRTRFAALSNHSDGSCGEAIHACMMK